MSRNQVASSDTDNDGQQESMSASGILEITDKGYGFLRQAVNTYRATPGDIFVGKDFVRQSGLRTGLSLEGKCVPPTKKKGGPKLEQLSTINGSQQMNIPISCLSRL